MMLDKISSLFFFGLGLVPEAVLRLLHKIAVLFGAGTNAELTASGVAMAVLLSLPLVSLCVAVAAGVARSATTMLQVEAVWQNRIADLCCLALVVLLTAMTYEVISRYVLGYPTKWAFELSYILLGTSFVLSIAFCLQNDKHVRVDVFYALLPIKGRALIDLLFSILLLPTLCWLMIGMIDFFERSYRLRETSGLSAWDPPIWPFKFALLLGVEILICHVVIASLLHISILKSKEKSAT